MTSSPTLLSKLKKYLIPLIFVSAIFLRLSPSLNFKAQYYDIGTYEAWGRIFLNKGPVDFFNSTWSDYLPLPIYFCSLIASLASSLNLSFSVLFKVSVSLIELILIFFIWFSVRSQKKWLLIPFLFLSPALIGDSSYWGQLDTIPSLLTTSSLLVVFNLINTKKPFSSKLIFSALLFGLAVSLKPIMLLSLPIFLILLFKTHRKLLNFFIFGLTSFALFLATAIPVAGINGSFSFLLDKTIEQSSTYEYTTINAWNLWSTRPLSNTWPSDLSRVLGATAQQFGYFLFSALAFLLFRSWSKSGWSKDHAFRVAGVLLVLFYTFTTRMHERHLLYGLPFLALASLSQSWLAIPLVLLTVTYTLNLSAAYSWVNNSQTWPVSQSFIQFVSWINVAVAALLATTLDPKLALQNVFTWLKSNKTLLAIIIIATCLRLINLSYPGKHIFDEVYHSFTAEEYLKNNKESWEWWTTPPKGFAYEWTHPPLAKYGMVLGMLLMGDNSLGWRFGSSIAGIASILGIYYLTRALFSSHKIAAIAAFLLTIEGLHLSQSRIGMNDIYMLCFYIWSLYCAVKSRWKSAAILYGLSLASKWAALYGIIPLAIVYLHEYPINLKLPNILSHLLFSLRLILIAVLIYILTFAPFLLAGHTWQEWWELHRQMWYYHTHLVATHGYQSTPWQWIFSLRPVWYFVDYGEKVANIYAQGNPAILWLGLVAFLTLLPRLLQFPYFLLFSTYLIFTVPWVFSPRIMFFYHYLPSVTFLCVILASWLTTLPRKSLTGILVLCCLSFILLSPVYYGIHMPKVYWDTLFTLFPSWK